MEDQCSFVISMDWATAVMSKGAHLQALGKGKSSAVAVFAVAGLKRSELPSLTIQLSFDMFDTKEPK